MNYLKSFVLFVFFSLATFAGNLTDDANIFGPDGNSIRNYVKESPVYIETHVKLNQSIQSYGNTRAKELPDNSLLVVITSQPREWRISMNPVGLVSSEGTRLAGDRMAAQFKSGHFTKGIKDLSYELNQMVENSLQISAPVTVSTKEHEPKDDSSFSGFTIFMIVIVLTLAIIGGALYYHNYQEEQARKKRREQEIKDENERKYQERLRKMREETSYKTPEPKPVSPAPESVVSNDLGEKPVSVKKTEDDPQLKKAKKLFNSYTPTERKSFVNSHSSSHYYSSSCHNDPLMFYLLYSSIDSSRSSDYSSSSSKASSSNNSSNYRSSSDDDSSYRKSSSSSSSSYSDSSSSYGSWDSGSSSSSYDSSSSSDSGGSSGSW